MKFEFRRGSRKVSQAEFFRGIEQDLLDTAINSYAVQLHGKASSMVDPDTGKHVPVFVRRVGTQGWTVHTSGTPAFARALEQRLGLNRGEVYGMSEPAKRDRLVYLAHASEDKAIAKPLAEGLMARGINVWYDNWEIGYGDSLRRKMEEGLGDCTHFVVLLTERSVEKPWVNEEIDAGLMIAVEGTAKFIGLRHDLQLKALSPFLRTRISPEFVLADEGLDALAGEIYGVSRKPPLGQQPRYVLSHDPGSTWSASAKAVAEYFVRASEHAQAWDPTATYAEIAETTALPMADVRIGILDLVGAGLAEKRESFDSDEIGPKSELFATFDDQFMVWSPEKDARDLAVYLLNLDVDQAAASEAGDALGWPARRFNSAAAYLVAARVIGSIDEYGGDSDYWPPTFELGDELLRFVRSI